MYLNDIDFPNKIIDSIQSHKFVVFAGAGASVDPPTSLPDFKNLTMEIAEGTGKTLTKKDSCEVFLGMLKSKGVPVNEHAAKILSGTCIEHNKLHEAIIDLFADTEDIKIVTTNYDEMFEQVLSSRGVNSTVFNAPALPLGSDIQGIIHIHGNVNDPTYMVVTDEDFGRAYLTEGYASRFLVKLFESYTVLFIGYSYNDTILRYLTRAMSRQNADKRYIITCDRQSDWASLGINPIWLPKGRRKFVTMREGLIKLGAAVKKDLLDWQYQLSAISDAPPKDLTVDTEIDYCLESIERSRVLANSVHGKAWIDFLNEKKVFEGCFSNTSSLSEADSLWGNWLCDNFVGKEDDAIIQLIYKHNNCISDGFINIIIQKLIRNKGINNEQLSAYIALFGSSIRNPWIVSRLVEDACEKKQYVLAYELYKHLLSCDLILQRGWYSKDSFEYKHSFAGNYYEIHRSWELIKGAICNKSPYDVMIMVRETIEKIHNQYVFVNKASKESEPWEMCMLNIEEHDDGDREDILLIIVQMYIDAADSLKAQDENLLKSALWHDLKSESTLMKKVVLKAIRITLVYKPAEVLDILINGSFLDDSCVKEQAFLLVSEFFMSFDDEEKDLLVDRIEAINHGSEDRTELYTVYNWLVWIQRVDGKNKRINSIVERLHIEYGFEPRKHPELNIESSSAVWIPDKSPLSEDELRELSVNDAVNYIKDYKGDQFDGPNRYGLLRVLENCVSSDYLWAKSIITELIHQDIKEDDIWEHVFYGLDKSEFSLEDSVDLLSYLSSNVKRFSYDKSVANFLFNILRREDIKEEYLKYENTLFCVSEKIWTNRSRKKEKLDRCIDLTLNTTTGIIVYSWIYMISHTNDLCIPEKYKDYFEKILNMKSWEKKVSVCLLAGHFNFLCYRDKDWCVDHLIPLLIGEEKNYFSEAWEGMVFFSGRINKDTVDIIAPVFLKAVKHIKWLKGEARRGFIELWLTLLIYVIDKPTFKHIPEFYRSATEDDVKQFIELIENRLNTMNDSEKEKWWDNWLKHFLDNRKDNKPVPITEKENQAILDLVLQLEVVFDSAVRTVCRGSIPQNVDGLFWFSLSDKHYAKKFPGSVALLTTKILNASSPATYDGIYIREIINELDGLEPKAERQLKEALLKNNIVI